MKSQQWALDRATTMDRVIFPQWFVVATILNQLSKSSLGGAIDCQTKCPLNVVSDDENHRTHEISIGQVRRCNQ
jgi:hypothetical protein